MAADKQISGRLIGVDYGRKRIGLAISDPDGLIASPFKQLAGSGDLARDAAAVITEADREEAQGFVVGLPVHMDGTEGQQARLSRAFAAKLTAATDRPVVLWDERLSSRTADAYLAEGQLTRKKAKARRDALAAQVILQSYLDHPKKVSG